MELPNTSPTGRKPASRTSRNSLTDRSDVNNAVGWPGRIAASRRIASSGTPSAVGICAGSWVVGSVMSCDSSLVVHGPRSSVVPQRQDREGAWLLERLAVLRDGRPRHERLRDVVTVAVGGLD